MRPSEPGSSADRTETVDPSSVVPAVPEPGAPRLRREVWLVALAAAVVAGLVAWLAEEATYGVFKPRLFHQRLPDGAITFQPTLGSQKVADTRNAALAFGLQGGIVALALGLAGCLGSRSARRGVMVGLVAALAGAAAGAASAAALFPVIYLNPVPDPNDLMTPLMVRAGIWVAIAVVAGAAFAIGFRAGRGLSAPIGGALIGAVLATLLYGLLHGLLSPASGPTTLVAAGARERLIAVALMSLLVAAGAVRGTLGHLHRPRSGPHPLDG